jgi:ABC-type Zn2+ transport system substrate-binding protein/surface adhesin
MHEGHHGILDGVKKGDKEAHGHSHPHDHDHAHDHDHPHSHDERSHSGQSADWIKYVAAGVVVLLFALFFFLKK